MTKEELKSYKTLCAETLDIEERMERLRSQAERTTSTISAIPGGGGVQDTIAEIAAQMADMAGQYEYAIFDQRAKLKRIEGAIQSLTDPYQRKMMRLRYLDGLTWERVCAATDFEYEWSQMHREHNKALKILKDF